MIRFNKESHEFWWSLYDTHTLSAEKVLEVTEIAVPSVTQILKTVGLISSYPIPSQYAERGTEIHELTELVDQGKFLPEFASDEVYPYISSYEQFLDEHEVNILGSESMVFSELHFYAGIYDRLCELDGDLVLVDIKTGGKERWHRVQLGMYLEGLKDSRDVSKIKTADLYLTPDSYKLVYTENDLDIKSLLDVYWFGRPQPLKQYRKLSGIGVHFGQK